MPTQTYALSKGGAGRLTLSWEMFWSNFRVYLDGKLVGTIPDQESLVAGQMFQLAGGSQLYIQLGKTDLEVLYNNRPLFPAYVKSVERKLNLQMGILLFIGIVTILVGVIGGGPFNPEKVAAYGWITAVLGIAYCILAIYVGRGSKIALGIAVGIYIIDTLAIFLFLAMSKLQVIYFIALAEHLVLLAVMSDGFRTIDELHGRNNYSSYSPSDEELQPLPKNPSLPSNYSKVTRVPTDLVRQSATDLFQTVQPSSENLTSSLSSELSVNQLLKQAIDIIKNNGDRQQAKFLVNEALKIERRNADGWYLIGYLADTKAEREAALERTLALNPNHLAAQQEFAKLKNG